MVENGIYYNFHWYYLKIESTKMLIASANITQCYIKDNTSKGVI